VERCGSGGMKQEKLAWPPGRDVGEPTFGRDRRPLAIAFGMRSEVSVAVEGARLRIGDLTRPAQARRVGTAGFSFFTLAGVAVCF
jgi:hypothetical protein